MIAIADVVSTGWHSSRQSGNAATHKIVDMNAVAGAGVVFFYDRRAFAQAFDAKTLWPIDSGDP